MASIGIALIKKYKRGFNKIFNMDMFVTLEYNSGI